MTLKEVPVHPAYVVFHDAFDHGAMDIWPEITLERAKITAASCQLELENLGHDDAGVWRAYEKLPRVRVYKFHERMLNS